MSRKLEYVVAATLVLVLLSSAFVFFATSSTTSPVQASESSGEERFVRVSASAAMEVKPDTASVQLGVQTDALTAEEARQANAQAMSEVIAAIKEWGVNPDKIQTTGFSLHQYHEYPPQPVGEDKRAEPIIKYRCTNNISVETNRLDDVGSLIDVAVAAGANSVHGVNFTISNKGELELVVLQDAVKNARAKADAMASAAGVSIVSVISMEEQNTYWSYPRTATMDELKGMGMDSASPTPVEAGEITIMATVTVKFGI